MTESIRVFCAHCSKPLKVPTSYLGRNGKCPACGKSFLIEQASVENEKQEPQGGDTPRPPKKPLAEQPTVMEELSNDRRRFLDAVAMAPDKYAIVEPFLMSYEQPIALAVQRQFPFSIFAGIVLLTSHRLLAFDRFFTSINMFDVNYVDLQNVKVKQGYFTSNLIIHALSRPPFSMRRLVTDQALNVYRHCQDIETKARIARRQYQLEENRSKTAQMQINNLVADPKQSVNNLSSPLLSNRHDISQIGAEVNDPYRIGE